MGGPARCGTYAEYDPPPTARANAEVEGLREAMGRVARLSERFHDDPALGELGPVVHALIREAIGPRRIQS